MESKTTVYDEPVQQEQGSILEDAIDTSDYERTMRRARIWLFVIAAFQLLVGIFEYATTPDSTVGLIAMGIDIFIGAIFFILALWSRRKPVQAFTLALVFYILIIVGLMLLDPANIIRGIIFKILVIIALVKANRDAREFVAAKSL